MLLNKQPIISQTVAAIQIKGAEEALAMVVVMGVEVVDVLFLVRIIIVITNPVISSRVKFVVFATI